MALPVLLMSGPAGDSPAERFVAQGQRAAACDLTLRLRAVPGLGPLHALCAEEADRQTLQDLGGRHWQRPQGDFHFGRALAAFAAEHGAGGLAYFGGASAPLLDPVALEEALEWLAAQAGPAAVVNNRYSTDWCVLNGVAGLADLAERLPTDNPLGWQLEHAAGFRVRALAPCAATRADVDTPSDLLLLDGHPGLGPSLMAFLDAAPADARARVGAIRRALSTRASTIALIGRTSSHVWRSLEARGQIWVRLLVEERGMIASGRAARSEVRSWVAMMLETWGAQGFVERLARMCDAALWDTRVWMAARGPWPSARDRFAADLGWPDQVQEPGLRALTAALARSPVPVLSGGHGVVAGSIYALLESLPAA